MVLLPAGLSYGPTHHAASLQAVSVLFTVGGVIQSAVLVGSDYNINPRILNTSENCD